MPFFVESLLVHSVGFDWLKGGTLDGFLSSLVRSTLVLCLNASTKVSFSKELR
jgi:hypothetical protein